MSCVNTFTMYAVISIAGRISHSPPIAKYPLVLYVCGTAKAVSAIPANIKCQFLTRYFFTAASSCWVHKPKCEQCHVCRPHLVCV